jgi:nucleotide-binding universal stress UspA family protein
MTAAPILVGFDGSRDSYAALRWAQDEAARHGVPVRLVYVYEWSTSVIPVPAGSGWPDPAVRHEAVATLDEAVARARGYLPEVPVDGTVIDGTVVSALSKLSERARLLVLGSRGLGGFSGLLAGSVAVGVATYARCPVVVTRGCARSRRPVAVGVDPSLDCDQALAFAFEQAISRGVDLVAVRAWQPPPVPSRSDSRPARYDAPALEASERQLVDQLMQSWYHKHPEVAATVRLMPDTAAHALITVSAEAQLTVVGCRGRGGFRGQLLGSVARQLIHHAHCPVVVIRHPPD